MPDYKIGSIISPTDTPGKPRIHYFAILPFRGTAEGDLWTVIAAIEAQYADDEAWKAHFRKLEAWIEALTKRAKYDQKSLISMTDRRFGRAQIVDVLFDDVVESFDNEAEFAAAILHETPSAAFNPL